MVSLCSDHQDASNNIHFDIEVTFRSRDEVMIYVHISMRINERMLGGNVSIALSAKAIGKKTPLF